MHTQKRAEYGVFILKLILSYLPVHLISPSLYLPDTQIKHFSHSPSGKYLCCLSCTSGTTTRQCGLHPHLHFNSQSYAMADECGEDGREHIRWTGKYDNISFRIKTPYWHTEPVHLISPVNNIYWRREAPDTEQAATNQ